MSEPKWVYRYDQLDAAEAKVDGDWDAVRSLMGGKGANLADMTRLGVPVPPGFTITTEACNAYVDAGGMMPDGLWVEVLEAMTDLETKTGKKYGDPENPLLVACRSGARISMPGMMDTVLDIGLNDEVVQGMVSQSGDARFVLDSYRRLIQMMGTVVLGVRDEPFEEVLAEHRLERGVANDSELTVVDLDAVVRKFKRIVEQRARTPFPADPYEQLRLAVTAVFESWQGKRARDYREAANIPHDLGTAVNVVAMVFGNTGSTSATGVAMSRDATTGENRLEGDYLMNAQGEDVVAGTRPTERISQLALDMPEVAQEFADIAKRLEQHYRDMQDMEFTVERGKLWLLQTRTGKRTAQAAVRIAVEMANEGLISRKEAVHRVTPEQVEFFLHPQFSPEAAAATATVATGLNVSPGAASGAIALDPDLAERWAAEGRQVLLVRPETKPDDVHGMLSSVGILTSSGGRTSHAALVARQFGKPAVVGAADLDIDMKDRVVRVDDLEIREGEWVSIDGTNGEVYAGEVETVPPDLDDEWLATLLDWADEYRTLGVRANADEGGDAAKARSYGAEGIGLCRTEHMFFHPERLPIVQRMITAPSASERREAVDALLPFQREDFAGLFEAMDGLPVIIRLLDPPLHEFLPHEEAELEALAERIGRTTEEIRRARNDLVEVNPMLGFRGCRLSVVYPEITRMQVRAIIRAALEVIDEGLSPYPEIMIPLVINVREIRMIGDIIDRGIRKLVGERSVSLRYRVGTMMETPRACLGADRLAPAVEFMSFGTNDLTQMTYGFSRDDAARFIPQYLRNKLIENDPFASLDQRAVGRLMRLAVEESRAVKPGIKYGICGEHGGDPQSIRFCHQLGLDYVSCSPYRVPVARIAAAQARVLAELQD